MSKIVWSERMTDLDFMIGTLNAASEVDTGMILRSGDRRVDAAFHAAYKNLYDRIEAGEVADVDLRFRIKPNHYHGDSETVFRGMATLYGLGYIVRQDDSNYYRFDRCFERSPDDIFDSIPSGSPELFRSLGKIFLGTLAENEAR